MQRGGAVNATCQLPGCVRLPNLRMVNGRYRVSAAAALTVGMPLAEDTSIPVRVAFVPLSPGRDTEATKDGLSMADVRASSSVIGNQIFFSDAVSVGRYQRIMYPQPPFDAFFPPVFATVVVPPTPTPEVFSDAFKRGAREGLRDATGLTQAPAVRRGWGWAGGRGQRGAGGRR